MYTTDPNSIGKVRATALGIRANDKIVEVKIISDMDIYFS
jgi:hypothetical protein